MSSPISAGLVTKQFQYVEESTFGVLPTNPVFNWVGLVRSIEPRYDVGTVPLPAPEQEDYKALAKGPEVYQLDMEYGLQNSTFAKYGINAQGGGAGSIDKSLSLLWSAKLGGATENFIQLNGARIDQTVLTGGVDQPTLARCQLIGKKAPVPSSTNPIGSGSYATVDGGNPWYWWNGGANPVTIAGTGVPVKTISLRFDRGLARLYGPEDTQVKFLHPTLRRITGTIELVWLDTAQYSNLANSSSVIIVWTLKTGTSTLTLTGAQLTLLESQPFRYSETIYERFQIVALSASLT